MVRSVLNHKNTSLWKYLTIYQLVELSSLIILKITIAKFYWELTISDSKYLSAKNLFFPIYKTSNHQYFQSSIVISWCNKMISFSTQTTKNALHTGIHPIIFNLSFFSFLAYSWNHGAKKSTNIPQNDYIKARPWNVGFRSPKFSFQIPVSRIASRQIRFGKNHSTTSTTTISAKTGGNSCTCLQNFILFHKNRQVSRRSSNCFSEWSAKKGLQYGIW